MNRELDACTRHIYLPAEPSFHLRYKQRDFMITHINVVYKAIPPAQEVFFFFLPFSTIESDDRHVPQLGLYALFLTCTLFFFNQAEGPSVVFAPASPSLDPPGGYAPNEASKIWVAKINASEVPACFFFFFALLYYLLRFSALFKLS